MQLNKKILSDLTVFMKYSKYLDKEHRRETWEELIERNIKMHHEMYPDQKNIINWAYEYVKERKVLPSMRSLQFAGKPIMLSPSRIFNCAYLPVESVTAFSEVMFSLLSGTGVGYSVQTRHIIKLPPVKFRGGIKIRHLVSDNIEGWANAVLLLMKSYFEGTNPIKFDYRDIRPKNSRLITTGGLAPGHEPLEKCLLKIDRILYANRGKYLTSLQCHDIMCHIADAVLAGGIRRAAMISLFDVNDHEMATCKHGNWWEKNLQRGRANNSVVLDRKSTTKEEFFDLFKKIKESNSGEPGIYWTNNKDYGVNPCCEISLRPYQMCNLTEIVASGIEGQTDFNERAKAASVIGTLQAGYTDFNYLNPEWKMTCEEDALLGIGITGIAGGELDFLDLRQAAILAKSTNENVASAIGINPAARITTVKPSGTSSLVAGTSSGIHAWHDKYYIRRLRINKEESIYKFLVNNHSELIVQDLTDPKAAIIEIPQEAPKNAKLRSESPFELLDRVKRFNVDWVKSGHVSGDNYNNVSCTVSVKENEWGVIGKWMWDKRYYYNGISLLPFDGGSYTQAPFESISKEEFNDRVHSLNKVDLTEVLEDHDVTHHSAELACSASGCELL